MIQNSFRFRRENRLITKNDFEKMRSGSKRIAISHLLVFFQTNELKRSRIGFSLSSQETAPKRNRIKRVFREWLRLNQKKLSSQDFHVVLSRSAATKASQEEWHLGLRDVELKLEPLLKNHA